ncbi:MAG: hypothetical protein C0507_11615 [Cyanobacteria bacterium PR.3.49]|nr:hypothetical protein [Cyanobacteria bacterium PR.3.49]
MKLALASILAVGLGLLPPQESRASGFIVVDPSFGGAVGIMPMPINVTPIRPGVPVRPVRPSVPPNPHRPILKGGVTFGLHLQAETIKVDVSDQVAKTYIVQTFKNDTDRNLAGTYLFPLPDDTTFSSFSLHIDGKPVEGKILEAQEARQQYETIVRQMVDPGLLEYADHKTVRARIFPIPAHGTKKVELEYTQLLKAENGLLKYSFPLKSKSGEDPVEEVKIDMKLQSKQGLRTIWSPTHVISSSRSNDSQAKVSFLAKGFVPDKDFLLYYSVSDKAMAGNVLTHKATNEDGYFLLTLSPPMKTEQVIAKDIVLVADTSGSMQGEKMEQLRKALKYVVNALNPADRFSIVQFNTDAEALKSQLMQATPENKKLALEFIDDLDARGGTNIGDALAMGTTMLNQTTDRPGFLVMMTDGEPTVGDTEVGSLLKKVKSKRDIRVFDFGVGNDLDTRLLNRLAEDNHGTAQYVSPDENIETALSSFYQKIKSPVLSDVSITYEGVQVKDIYPRSVKDIFQGSQVLLLGKYKGGGNAKVNVTGKVNGVAKSYSFPLVFAAQEAAHTYLPRLWAMRRIGYLTEVAKANGDNREVVDEIVALSKKHGIISAYTSFLSTDPNEGRLSAQPVRPTPMRGRRMNVRAESSVVAAAGGGGRGPVTDRATWFRAPRQVLAPEPMASPAPSAGAPADESRSGFKGFVASPLVGKKLDLSSSLARQIASAPYSGSRAVAREKEINKMKTRDVVQEREGKSAGVKWIEGKTFYLRDGFWTDSAILEATHAKEEVIEFGSAKYFELVRKHPGITKFLGAGARVIVLFEGRCLKIVAP